jgi:hypothetical protein
MESGIDWWSISILYLLGLVWTYNIESNDKEGKQRETVTRMAPPYRGHDGVQARTSSWPLDSVGEWMSWRAQKLLPFLALKLPQTRHKMAKSFYTWIHPTSQESIVYFLEGNTEGYTTMTGLTYYARGKHSSNIRVCIFGWGFNHFKGRMWVSVSHESPMCVR